MTTDPIWASLLLVLLVTGVERTGAEDLAPILPFPLTTWATPLMVADE